MDPLSVTLAVITVATAVKDMVELGQKIHKSFARVSKNYHNAQLVAKNIKDMVEQIRVFCEDHKDALDNMKEFHSALQGLLNKFRSFEASILPLLPPVGGRKREFLIRSWREWRNSSKVERSILDLERNVVTVMRTHMMNSAMRIEVKQETNHQEMRRGLTDAHHDITQRLEVLDVVRRDVSAIRTITATTMTHRLDESSVSTSDEFTRNVITFVQSTPSSSAPMLRTPNVITEELLTTAYIKLQINSITLTVENLSTLPASTLNNGAPNSVTPFWLALILDEESMSITHLRHHVVRQVLGIRGLLDTKQIHTISIKEGASALTNLSVGLRALGMGEEALLVGQWAITLARLLVAASGDGRPDLAARLALTLLSQSRNYHRNGNDIKSLQAIEEAHTIAQSHLWDQYWGESDFREIYSDILLQYAKLQADNQRSIEMCIEAVQVLEDILNVHAYTQSNLPGQIQNVVDHNSSFIDNLFSFASPETAISSYADALHDLGIYLARAIDGHSETALHLRLLAIAVRRKMVDIHGHKHKVQLAWILSSLVQSRTARHIPAEELDDMVDECIQIYQELADKNPLYYARALVHVLAVRASTLDKLNRDTEAIATMEEIASLARQIIQDSKLYAQVLDEMSHHFRRLKRHDDAVRTGRLAITTYHERAKTQAARYFYLSRDLQQLRRYKESAEAASVSVTLYRRLAMSDPGTWMGDLTEGLSDLSHCLAALGDYSGALIAWKESVNMLDNFVNTNQNATPEVIDKYLAALAIHKGISYALKDEAECLEVCFTAVQYLSQLSGLYPQNIAIIQHLLQADYCHTYNMLRVGHLQDAQQYIAHWIDIWSGRPEAVPESGIMAWHAAMVIFKAEILNGQGYTKEALSTIQKVPDIVGLSATAYQFEHSQLIFLMVHKSSLQVNLGDIDEALQVAEEALQLSRDNKPGPDVDNLVWSLHAVALTALSRQDYKRAIEAAQEGCSLSASPNWQGVSYDIFMRPNLFAFWSSAEANLGRCSTALEYAHCAVNASLDIGEMKAKIPATVAEHSYMETRGYLADILLATGDLAQAREICKERSVYFSKRVEKRMGEYRDLAPILRMLGILCCSEGNHEEGVTAAKELSRIMKTLGSAFPSLQEEVKIRLRNQAKVPILKVLDDMQQKLDCEHQAEVLSLFEM